MGYDEKYGRLTISVCDIDLVASNSSIWEWLLYCTLSIANIKKTPVNVPPDLLARPNSDEHWVERKKLLAAM